MSPRKAARQSQLETRRRPVSQRAVPAPPRTALRAGAGAVLWAAGGSLHLEASREGVIASAARTVQRAVDTPPWGTRWV